MITRLRALAELLLAVAAFAGAAVCWSHARHTVAVAPVADGQPSTWALAFDPQLLLLTVVLLTIAGIFVVIGVARLGRPRAV